LEYCSQDPIIKGRYFTDSDYYTANKVCVITESSAKTLFGFPDTDLPGTLRDRYQHDVHNTDTAYQQGDGCYEHHKDSDIIRKALGARTGSILLQFLSESAIITLLGGLIGITIGVAGAFC